jgi:hypothetical protein
MTPHDEFTEDDWTPDERALFAALPQERIPPGELKARTTDALRRRGLLDHQPVARSTHVLALVAAASAIFIAGALVGYAAAQRSVRPIDNTRAATRHDVAEAPADGSNPPTRHVVWY